MKPAFPRRLILLGLVLLTNPLLADEPRPQNERPRVVSYGEMHLAIGRQQHQGRVLLQDLVKRKHFYGVGALAGLNGEITIRDGEILVTTVSAGKPEPLKADSRKAEATLLVGAYIAEWSEHAVTRNVSWQDFDEFIRESAVRSGLDTTRPFMFRIEGEFQNARLHIIHGACPVHARIHQQELPAGSRPYEADFKKIRGTLIGVYAEDAVGKLTHPATSSHVHLIFKDKETGTELTGHLERVGIAKDAVLSLPQR